MFFIFDSIRRRTIPDLSIDDDDDDIVFSQVFFFFFVWRSKNFCLFAFRFSRWYFLLLREEYLWSIIIPENWTGEWEKKEEEEEIYESYMEKIEKAMSRYLIVFPSTWRRERKDYTRWHTSQKRKKDKFTAWIILSKSDVIDWQ